MADPQLFQFDVPLPSRFDIVEARSKGGSGFIRVSRIAADLHDQLSVFVWVHEQQPEPPTQEAVPDQLGDTGDSPPVDPGVGRS